MLRAQVCSRDVIGCTNCDCMKPGTKICCSCAWTSNFCCCCKGGNQCTVDFAQFKFCQYSYAQCCCCVTRRACMPDDTTPLGFGCFTKMCCGGPAPPKTPQQEVAPANDMER